jgi:H+/Na+-translocating ferredoxin:NAD+ oxidoreductase subunit B
VKDSVYNDLYEKLSVTPTGVPKREKLVEILRILFTPEEAGLALILPFMPTPLSDIADAAGMDLEYAKRTLSRMADKGLVYAAEENGIFLFMLFPVAWTLFKFPLMSEVPGVDYQRLKRLCREFLAEDTLIGENTLNAQGKHVPIGRVLPIQENLSSETEVLPQDLVYHYIDRAEFISVSACSCRKIVGACDSPKEVCMAFGYQAKYLVERKMARPIETHEAKRIHRMASDAGLVSVTSNTKEEVGSICHCCPCCCAQLGAATRHGRYDLVPKGTYIAAIDAHECNGCGFCSGKCPTKAIVSGGAGSDETARIELERCIGCGLCVSSCPEDAISMVQRMPLPDVPKDVAEWMEKAVETRGVKEEFLRELKIRNTRT